MADPLHLRLGKRASLKYGGPLHSGGCGTVGGGSIGEAIRKGYDKARFLQTGYVVEMEVEGLGLLRSTIGPKENEDPDYRYQPKEQPPLPERGIARDYKYQPKPR